MITPTGWWGEHDVPDGTQSYWRLGALEFVIGRHGSEWALTSSLGDEVLDETRIHEPATTRSVDGQTLRIVGGAESRITLTPRLLDRTVVSRPLSPVAILPNTTVGIFMTTPTEIVVSAGGQELSCLASANMRRTWIGPNTRTGELGFSTRTTARLELSYLSVHPTRAVTHVRIQNQGPDALRLDRVNLPVRQLALFASTEGRLWTAEVRLQVKAGRVEDVQVEPDPPELAGEAALLVPAREVLDRSVMRRVLGALFA